MSFQKPRQLAKQMPSGMDLPNAPLINEYPLLKINVFHTISNVLKESFLHKPGL
jgi:hypothetical protein